jgi:hypothetical protein
VIRVKQLAQMRPLLETVLSRDQPVGREESARGRASSLRDTTTGSGLIQLKTSGNLASDSSGT